MKNPEKYSKHHNFRPNARLAPGTAGRVAATDETETEEDGTTEFPPYLICSIASAWAWSMISVLGKATRIPPEITHQTTTGTPP